MKVGRNASCPCGSGKKLKKCCGNKPKPLKSSARRSSPPADECNQLIDLFNSRRYAELEDRSKRLIELYPDSGFTWKMLGIVLQIEGKQCRPALQKAVELMPDDVELHNALGNELKKLGQLADAETSYRRVIEINPDHAIAHYNLGNVFQIQKRLTAAEACYRRALEIKPDLAEGHNNLGAVLKDLGQFAAAETSYRRALRLKPDSAVTHNNLGNILGDLGQHSAAVESFRRALELQPNSRIIHLQRNPIDTCLSIYFNNLEAHSYANDLDNIAHFYKQYLRIMNHWHESLPQDVILNVPYEELVTDQEGWTRTLLDFIGVSWNECCLDFQKTARRVSTASNWQVRQKISTSSVERWRNYKNFIEPLGVYFPDTWQDTVRE